MSGNSEKKGPFLTPSARTQNHVGSGCGAGITLVPSAHASFGGSGGGFGGAGGSGGAFVDGGVVVDGIVTTRALLSDTSMGADLGPAGPEPQATPNVKTKGNV
jgi:hypothetical protein